MAVLVEDRARPSGGIIRTVTLARPDRRNALDPDHLDALARAIADAEQAPAVRTIVLAGQGTAFCAGYDLTNPLASIGGGVPDEHALRTVAAVQGCPVPTVARIHGPAFGAGLHLAIACDVRVASETASFCLPPAKLGFAYSAAGLSRLVALVGTGHAQKMAFTGEVIGAARAHAIGLVEELMAPSDLDARVVAVADAMADAAPLAVRAMKKTFALLEPRLTREEIEASDRERLACYASDDAAEGLKAFAEKRPPVFRGR